MYKVCLRYVRSIQFTWKTLIKKAEHYIWIVIRPGYNIVSTNDIST